MKVKQISVFLENKQGRLWEALHVLAEAKINIRALAVADTSEFGILRLIAPKPDAARRVLKENRFTVAENDVIAVGVADRPGGLADVLGVLKEAGLNVEYLYAFVQKSGRNAVVVLRTEDINSGIKALQDGKITVLSAREVYQL